MVRQVIRLRGMSPQAQTRRAHHKKVYPERSRRVRVRIAPSPTGFAHVGTAYVALLNYAFAKNVGGKFIIRLEDTDVKREVKGAEQAIYEGLSWLGLSWDEGPDIGGRYGPYRQSERVEIYQDKVNKLVKSGFAYEHEGAVRFKNLGEDVGWTDLIRGKINFPGDQITDFVIVKSDGYPTYNFAVVIDDLLMKISHVIRGEEHISNTPRQLAIYKAFNEKPPKFAHLPTLRNKDRKKLSKRRDPVDLKFFKKQGYLSEALVNFLCLLGWSHPKEKEIFDLAEFVKLFDLKRVRKAGPIFNIEKLDWLNGQYIQKLSNKELAKRLKPFAPKNVSVSELQKITPLVKTRLKKLSEFESLAGPLFVDPGRPPQEILKRVNKEHIEEAVKDLSNLSSEEWSEKLDESVLATVEKNKFKTGDFFMSLRIAEFSSNVTPSINDSMKYLGKEESIKRLKRLT